MVTWQNDSVNLSTLYTVEYITNASDWKKVCDSKHPTPWELYQKKSYDSLDEALTFYLVRLFSSKTFDVKLFEQIQVNGVDVREAYIEPSDQVFDGIRSAIDMEMRNRLNDLETRVASQEKELAEYYSFISTCKLSHSFNRYREANKKV